MARIQMLECVSCFTEYMQGSSDAKTSCLYCSQDCEVQEDLRLEEGLKIVKEYEEQLDALGYISPQGKEQVQSQRVQGNSAITSQMNFKQPSDNMIPLISETLNKDYTPLKDKD